MELYLGDCLEEMKKIPDGSVDLVLTDPPYELGFMGKSWDSTGIANNVDVWKECLRVLKPGGYLLSFGGTRTYHRMASAIEDAGFEVRDMIEWVYGSGFPKSLNIGKVADKFLKTGNASWNGTGDSSNGALGYSKLQHKQDYRPEDYSNRHQNKDKITEEKAKQWEGWGTALKPAHEPICMARKPLAEKTVVENCLKYGTGGINIDASRVGTEVIINKIKENGFGSNFMDDNWKPSGKEYETNNIGRFPANLIHDNSEEVRECFPETKSKGHNPAMGKANPFGGDNDNPQEESYFNDSGNASRFFKSIMTDSLCTLCCLPFDIKHEWKSLLYQAKASKRDRGDGNNHPTVKPVALMEYLITMTSREGATILDPFMGSGTTGVACKNLNRNFMGIEMDETYFNIAKERIDNA